MQKQRNAVDKSHQELADSIKLAVDQSLYAALGEAKVDREKARKILAIVNASIDETYGRSSKHFDKIVDALVAAVLEVSRSNLTKSSKT